MATSVRENYNKSFGQDLISRSLYIKEAVLTRKAKANWNDSFNSYQKEKREEEKDKKLHTQAANIEI